MTGLDLHPGSLVTLDLGAHGDFPVRVEWGNGDRLGVTLQKALPVLASALVGFPARLAYATPRGVCYAGAEVVAAARGGLLELALAGETEVEQRRGHVRVAAPLLTTVRPAGASRPVLHTFTIDVSGAGVLVAGAGRAAVGDEVTVTLKVPGQDEPMVAADGRVVRRTANGHVAIAFAELARTDRERLVRFVFERQRQERRASRGPR